MIQRRFAGFKLFVLAVLMASVRASAQEYGRADSGQAGDASIQAYLRQRAAMFPARFLEGVQSVEDWLRARPRYREEYLHMLGLWPLPEKTDAHATITGTVNGEGFVVDNLHYQSRPRLYVTANLYRPSAVPAGRRLPAVLYVCGHSHRGRNGNKTAYQSHGIWLARHGYVCLMVDTLQLGEIAAIHHGTYREQRWWWHSRGYTPAGVECWNGVRGIDYLLSREDVDPDRIAVTGISGGGAATIWVAAADDRVRVAAPVSGMADLPSYVGNRVINGHCDCMFLYNTFQWPWTRILALIAPRPLLFVNSDADAIFPMDANERIAARLERLYSLYGAGDQVDALVSVGGHAYREDIRRAVFRWLNMHLKDDPRPVGDSEIDLVEREGREYRHPIAPEDLRVFPTDADIPADELNTTIDQVFVPMATVERPKKGAVEAWRSRLLAELRRITFRNLPREGAVAARPPLSPDRLPDEFRLTTDEGVEVAAHRREVPSGEAASIDADDGADSVPSRVVLTVASASDVNESAPWPANIFRAGDIHYRLFPRGTGPSRWTRKNPPNYVERCHVLLGDTADAGRMRDVALTARVLAAGLGRPVHVAGRGATGLIVAYAALWEPAIAELTVIAPPGSHMHAGAPHFLNILRVCDVPQMLGMLAPRPLRLLDAPEALRVEVQAVYETAGARGQVR